MGKSPHPALMATLLRHYGTQHWWPARTRFEVIVGAFLVQNTAWTNAKLALRRLRAAKVLTPVAIRKIRLRELEQLVRSSGYFRQKARSLKTFVRFLDVSYGGSLHRMFARPAPELRRELLTLTGVGEETADVILLYAGGHEAFVVDVYARRVAERHGIMGGKYADFQRHFVAALAGMEEVVANLSDHAPRHEASPMSRRGSSAKTKLYAEAHAVLVRVGNDFCRRIPECEECPLRPYLPRRRGLSARG
ncbi:MAG: base excision DNA repair protein [Terriglobales bacterium]